MTRRRIPGIVGDVETEMDLLPSLIQLTVGPSQQGA